MTEAERLEVVKLFVSLGADVNQAPGGGLFAAGWYEDLEILDLLVGAGAEVDVVVGDQDAAARGGDDPARFRGPPRRVVAIVYPASSARARATCAQQTPLMASNASASSLAFSARTRIS